MKSLTDYLTFAVVFSAVFAVVFSVVTLLVWNLLLGGSRKEEPKPKVIYRQPRKAAKK